MVPEFSSFFTRHAEGEKSTQSPEFQTPALGGRAARGGSDEPRGGGGGGRGDAPDGHVRGRGGEAGGSLALPPLAMLSVEVRPGPWPRGRRERGHREAGLVGSHIGWYTPPREPVGCCRLGFLRVVGEPESGHNPRSSAMSRKTSPSSPKSPHGPGGGPFTPHDPAAWPPMPGRMTEQKKCHRRRVASIGEGGWRRGESVEGNLGHGI